MKIFVNLKRFDVPRNLGGTCATNDPAEWIVNIIEKSVEYGFDRFENAEIVFLLPESLLITAKRKLIDFSCNDTNSISIGSQGVFREDVEIGGNFGAFTTNLPATAVKNMGCKWSILGHSEERKDKFGILFAYDKTIESDFEKQNKANNTVNSIINKEVLCALKNGIKVLICVGETAKERGEGVGQEDRIKEVIANQLEIVLKNTQDYNLQENIVIGYEPIWAIGPGKIPPNTSYISFVSKFIKEYCNTNLNFKPSVVYGGGLKEENAQLISSIDTIDGGLLALTRFTGEIGFYLDDFKNVVNRYRKAKYENRF